MNGFFVLLPITNPTSSWSGESGWGGGISACVGATIFEVGSILLMLEAVNENRADCFGWALEEALEDSRDNLLQLRREASDECRHHHVEKTAWLSRNRRGNSSSSSSLRSSSEVPPQASSRRDERKWTWCPSWNELRSHYFRDIGFLACFSQMIGATVFWISGFTGLPQILNVLTVPATNGIYWLPQVRPFHSSISTVLSSERLDGYPRTHIANALLAGRGRYGLHHFQLALHARDPVQVVRACAQTVGLANWLLEPGRRPRLHPLWRSRLCLHQFRL